MTPRLFLIAAATVLSTSGYLAAENPRVKVSTSVGDFVIELDAEKAPITVENFLSYTEKGFFDGTVFHRVIKGFMIQGGGMTPDLRKKDTAPPIKNESSNGLLNQRYTVAMARTSDPGSATSQFFVNTANNGFLNQAQSRDGFGYAVFGKVVEGTEVVDAIESVETGRVPNPEFPTMPMGDVPKEPIVITSVKVVQPEG